MIQLEKPPNHFWQIEIEKKHTHIYMHKYTHNENEWMWFTLGAGFMAPQLIKCDSKLQQQPDPLEKNRKKIYSNYGLAHIIV